MSVLETIIRKRNGQRLSAGEIKELIDGYSCGDILDYQMASFLMAVYFQGMSLSETIALTEAMAHSGKTLHLTGLKGMVIDKHSTGGVGDGISLALAPLVAAAGLPVLMMSGRGLGHTGGTLDKLASIPGFRTALTSRQALRQVRKIGVAMIGQTAELAPADKKIYALRDATGTVENISLICASILSKKIAAGIDGLVLDVKFGNGAFMPNYAAAKQLTQVLITVGKKNGLKIKALVTDMNQPLGNAVGNSLEISQAIEVLKGEGPADFMTLTLALGAEMLVLGKKAGNVKEAEQILRGLIPTGQALDKFYCLVKTQGGKINQLPVAKHKLVIKAPVSGYIYSMSTREIGLVATMLGAGRQKKEDLIDYSAGILLHKKIGDPIQAGDLVATMYYNKAGIVPELKKRLLAAIVIRKTKPARHPLIYN
ncbi:MAG: thymidine phosphorylase [bacterium]|nr:thymidine phosphorylase [bacterium]MDD5354658.1 thymidine phosphorylase [bacterium]MDD5756039.1 thymidine phosphorylase [bacterium]